MTSLINSHSNSKERQQQIKVMASNGDEYNAVCNQKYDQ
jgi:hypothetical protein